MQLFYHPELNSTDSEFSIPKEESRHIVKVLRLKTGDQIHFTNGQGWLFNCTLISANEKKCILSVDQAHYKDPRSIRLHMAVAPTKMNDRFEWFLEKATEIGIEEITPIICANSERKQIKINRMQRIIESALKQSQQLHIPVINEQRKFTDFIQSEVNEQKFIAHCMNGIRTELKNSISSESQITILIGPEGDFSVKEIEMALEGGYIPVNLGQSRLRTETAAIVACHTVALAYD